jgi:DNA-binding NtrC family response regulator
MNEKIGALVVYSNGGPMRDLQRMLTNQFVKVRQTRTCREAASCLEKPNPPHLIFTDSELLDGTWAEILDAAIAAPAAVNVILVVRADEIKGYLEAVQRGVFDLMTPPFSEFDVAHLVKNAVANVLGRRGVSFQQPSRFSRPVPAS